MKTALVSVWRIVVQCDVMSRAAEEVPVELENDDYHEDGDHATRSSSSTRRDHHVIPLCERAGTQTAHLGRNVYKNIQHKSMRRN